MASHHPLLSRKNLTTLIGVIASLLCLAGCGPSSEELNKVHYSPLQRADWKVSSPEEQNLDPTKVAELYYHAGKLEKIRSLLVVKNGYLVAEDYFNDGAIDQKDRLQSVTKSVTSALVGIALNEGLMADIDQPVLDYFRDVSGTVSDPRKRRITVRQLLQMRSGYPWEESDPALWQALLSGHYPPLLQDFPLVTDPGSHFHYSNLSSNWLGIMVDRVSGMHLKQYAQEVLFSPLGITPGDWGTDAEGHNNGCGDLHLSARDAAKFGQLYLDEGVFSGRQIIPKQWVYDSLKSYSVNEFTVKHVGHLRNFGYGYQWWSADVAGHPVNFAWGHGGQLIVLVDELDLLVVITSYPFWLEHNADSWKHEKANIKLVGDFLHALIRG